MTDQRVVPMSQHEASLAASPNWTPALQAATALEPVSKAWITGEPRLSDLLADPLVHAVLRRDGLSLRDLRHAIAQGRSRLASSAQQHSTSTAA